jgi:outer membrane protein
MKQFVFPLAAVLVASASAQAADVIVTVRGVEVGQGAVSVGICDTGLGGEHCPVGGQQESTAETLEFVFQNIPAGYYAFGAHQDLNKNGERDENFLGIPKEPVALSNNALEKMIPTFADAQVPVAEGGDNRIEIVLQMYGSKKAKSAQNQN